MEKIVVDSSIIFSALYLLNPSIRERLETESFRFYAPKFLFVEIFKHKERLIERSKASHESILEILSIILHYINFIKEESISTANYLEAYSLCKDIDENDVSFVAMAIALNCRIWTSDGELKKGLLSKGFNRFFDENELEP